MRVLMVTPELPSPDRPGTMAPTARQIESIRALGVEIEVLEVRGARRVKYLQRLGNLLAMADGVDLVHAHYGFCGWLARSQRARPVVVSFMGDDLLGTPDAAGRIGPLSRCAVRADCWLAHRVDAVIVKSREMARIIAPASASVIPNGVDLQAFRPMDLREARARLRLANARRYVLVPGRPEEPRKNFPLARDVVGWTAESISGPPELLALGGISPDLVPIYMNACDAMLLTSLWEGSPNVVKEAMACNLPVVSVPVGDVADLLAGVEGCTVCPRDVQQLARGLTQVLRRRRRTNGRIAVEQKGLDLPSVARKVMNVYRDVLSRKRAAAA
jgi:glycosyltransferase involved in cell wall biosynthesis